jgi:hypothetical protein
MKRKQTMKHIASWVLGAPRATRDDVLHSIHSLHGG